MFSRQLLQLSIAIHFIDFRFLIIVELCQKLTYQNSFVLQNHSFIYNEYMVIRFLTRDLLTSCLKNLECSTVILASKLWKLLSGQTVQSYYFRIVLCLDDTNRIFHVFEVFQGLSFSFLNKMFSLIYDFHSMFDVETFFIYLQWNEILMMTRYRSCSVYLKLFFVELCRQRYR